MKKNSPSKTVVTNLTSVDSFAPLMIGFILLVVGLIMSSCSDDEPNFSADIAKVVGTYDVADTDEEGEVDNYMVTITKVGNGVEFANFGDFMYKPVKATIKGTSLEIPTQTFKANTMTIKIYGQGTVTGDKINFNYTVETNDAFVEQFSCAASRLL